MGRVMFQGRTLHRTCVTLLRQTLQNQFSEGDGHCISAHLWTPFCVGVAYFIALARFR